MNYETLPKTISAEELLSTPLPPVKWIIPDLLPAGLALFAGPSKAGKSWLTLWLCLQVAQGKPMWGREIEPHTVLYLSLEDTFNRLQKRLLQLVGSEEAPERLVMQTECSSIGQGLEEQLVSFIYQHPDTGLIVIDTLQKVRSSDQNNSMYASDYKEISALKALADKYNVCILLIHHLRKLHDDDPMNMISGSTGLSGAADSTFVLQKSSRLANIASLHCTGRDIPDRTLKLELDEDDHVWKLLADSKTCSSASKISALQLVHLFSALLSADPAYTGTPSALSAKIDPDGSLEITPKKVTRLVLESVETLRENGILVKIYRSNGKRLISLRSAESADLPTVGNIDPIDPVGRQNACTAP